MTSSNFSTTISSGVTLVDFWATWCRPCLMQAPIVEEVAVEIGNKATIGKLDVDQAGMIAQQYGIRNIPTILIFKDGEVVERFVGLKDKQSLLNAINKHL
ncbi:MAG: thioredoxin [Bacteroidota bacterium]|nr:thioredoxin [Bacteroidota bacterium]